MFSAPDLARPHDSGLDMCLNAVAVEAHGSVHDTPSSSAVNCTGTVADYVRSSVSENTRRAYRFDLEHFAAWGGTIPAADVMVAQYLADHAGTLAVATLVRRLATISKAHSAKGLPSPTSSALVQSTLRGIKRAHAKPQEAVSPLLVSDLREIMCTHPVSTALSVLR